MSIRRTQATVNSLWRAMEGQLPPPPPQGQRHRGDPGYAPRARASPPPDPEAGYGHGRLPDLAAEAMQPPRLQGGSCCSKLLITSMCCSLLLIALVACNALLSQPLVVQARASVQGRLAPAARPAGDAKRPLPALLHRFGALKRVPGGQKGGVEAVRAAFPRWRATDGSLKLEDAVADLAFGLAAVVEQLDPALELKVVTGYLSPPPPPSPEEPVLSNDDSEEELEL